MIMVLVSEILDEGNDEEDDSYDVVPRCHEVKPPCVSFVDGSIDHRNKHHYDGI